MLCHWGPSKYNVKQIRSVTTGFKVQIKVAKPAWLSIKVALKISIKKKIPFDFPWKVRLGFSYLYKLIRKRFWVLYWKMKIWVYNLTSRKFILISSNQSEYWQFFCYFDENWKYNFLKCLLLSISIGWYKQIG